MRCSQHLLEVALSFTKSPSWSTRLYDQSGSKKNSLPLPSLLGIQPQPHSLPAGSRRCWLAPCICDFPSPSVLPADIARAGSFASFPSSLQSHEVFSWKCPPCCLAGQRDIRTLYYPCFVCFIPCTFFLEHSSIFYECMLPLSASITRLSLLWGRQDVLLIFYPQLLLYESLTQSWFSKGICGVDEWLSEELATCVRERQQVASWDPAWANETLKIKTPPVGNARFPLEAGNHWLCSELSVSNLQKAAERSLGGKRFLGLR